VLVLAALAGRWASLLPLGLVGVGAAYAVYLSLRSGTIDPRAPIVAAALFAAAELAYWSIERQEGRAERAVLVRRTAFVLAGALATAILGSILLIMGGGGGGLALEAMGVVAAVALLAVIAFLSARPRGSPRPDPR
jgi:hypothetical protein